MSGRTIKVTDALYQYLFDVSVREPDLLRRVREEASQRRNANLQIAPEQGMLLALLAQLTGARRCLEVGVFTGYSSLSVARVLPDDGTIVACDVNEDYTSVARRFWREAGIDHKIDLRVAPALHTLDELIDAGEQDCFDFAFIDADKGNYRNYYERALVLCRPGGLVTFDNTLWGGRVADPDNQSPDTEAIRAFNAALYDDERIDLSLVPIGDGLTLARKR